MARDDNDDMPQARPTRWLEAKPLDTLSVAELADYVVALKAEIARAEAAADAKKSHRAGIEAIFGKKN